MKTDLSQPKPLKSKLIWPRLFRGRLPQPKLPQPRLLRGRQSASSATTHTDTKGNTTPCSTHGRTLWYGLFECDDEELVFAPAPSRVTSRFFSRLSSRFRGQWTVRLNNYPRIQSIINWVIEWVVEWVVERIIGRMIKPVISLIIYGSLHYWRILWFGRKNAEPPPKVMIPLNIEPWTGRILPHPRESAAKNPMTRIADHICWLLACRDTRYVTHALRMKRRRESALAWHCHRLHSILRGAAPGTPRFMRATNRQLRDGRTGDGQNMARQNEAH